MSDSKSTKASTTAELTEEEKAAKKERLRRQKAQCIELAMEHMGWSREKARKHVETAHAEIGISYRDYRRFFFFKIPEAEQKERYAEILQGKEFRKSRKSNEHEKYITNIMKYTGLPRETVVGKMKKAREICGATYKDYYAFRFWEIDESEQTQYFTQKRSNALSAQYDTNEFSRDILLNKELSCIYFSEYMHRAWCINRAVTLKEFMETFKNSEKIVYKPLDGNGGHGVEVFKLKEETPQAVYDKIKGYPRGVVEDFVVQHPAMSSLAPGSVNTIRIVTFAYNDGSQVVAEGEYPVDVAYAAVRIGSGTSIVDNFTEGGFVVGVDLESGTIATDGVTIEGTPFECHPMTGTRFKGFKIPHFDMALDMVKQAGKKIGGYTGWDIAITEEGPVLIEANIMPGNRILQMPYVKERKGMMHIMEKYYDVLPEEGPVSKAVPNEVIKTSVSCDDRAVFANERLAAYEIKKPDYDYISRSYVGLDDVEYDPERYVKHGGQWYKFPVSQSSSVRLMFTGDITCFEKQFAEASLGAGYDFSYSFDKIKNVFKQADLVVGNLETMVFPGAPYRTEKYVSEQNFHCNGPLEILDALKKAGFDVLTNANNHVLDTGAVGIGETIDNVKKFGFIQTGTFKTDKKRYEFFNIDGFKVALVAFATGFNNKECNLTKEGRKFLLNEYSKQAAEKVLADALAEGAEYVIVSIHWGQENKLVSNDKQNEVAAELAQMGYSCIIGSHPHVLQQFDMIDGKNGKVPVFFSLGNFISHNANNNKARSAVVCLDLKRENGKVAAKLSYVPIFTSNRYGDRKYVVLPISNVTVSPRNRKKMERIAKVLGNGVSTNKELKFRDYREKKGEKEETFTPVAPDLSNVSEFPVEYNSGKFIYQLYQDHACLSGFCEDRENFSYTIDGEILGLPITEMTEGCFEGFRQIKKMNFNRGITKIPAYAFKGCTELEGFQLGRAVTRIGKEAFADCGMLSAAVMKNKVKTIASRAFANDTALRTVKIPESVTKIADDAFENCGQLTIYCEKDTYAEEYANKHGIPCVIMDLQ